MHIDSDRSFFIYVFLFFFLLLFCLPSIHCLFTFFFLLREETVLSKCQELTLSMPGDYIEDDYEERISAMGGFQIPLNIFLYQEVQRYVF